MDDKLSRGKRIQWLIMDVDGTLTDGKIYLGSNGFEMKSFDIKDGYGIRNLLPLYEIEPVVITGRTSDIVSRRCKELGITQLHQGIQDKKSLIKRMIPRQSLSQIAYIGDDLNDLSALEMVRASGGVIGCPLDAAKEVKAVSHFVSQLSGGSGAVRDFIEWLISILQQQLEHN